jgi:hypothetical protein
VFVTEITADGNSFEVRGSRHGASDYLTH